MSNNLYLRQSKNNIESLPNHNQVYNESIESAIIIASILLIISLLYLFIKVIIIPIIRSLLSQYRRCMRYILFKYYDKINRNNNTTHMLKASPYVSAMNESHTVSTVNPYIHSIHIKNTSLNNKELYNNQIEDMELDIV